MGTQIERVPLLCLPYISGFSEAIERSCNTIGVKVIHQTTRTLRSLLMKVKTPIAHNATKGIIYKIPCQCGEVYIGDTSKTMKDRMKEHHRAVRRGDNNNSLAVHADTNDHHIDWQGAGVMDIERNQKQRKIKEAINIRRSRCMNMDQGITSIRKKLFPTPFMIISINKSLTVTLHTYTTNKANPTHLNYS